MVSLLNLTVEDLSDGWNTVHVADVGLLQSDGLVLDHSALHGLDVGVDLLVGLSVGLGDLVDSHTGLNDLVSSGEGLRELVSSSEGLWDIVSPSEGLWLPHGLNRSRDLGVNPGLSLNDIVLTGRGLLDIEGLGTGLSLPQSLGADLRGNSVSHTVSDRRWDSSITGGNQAVVLVLVGAWDGSSSVSVSTVEGDSGFDTWDSDGGVSNDLGPGLGLLAGDDLGNNFLSWVEG